MPEVQGEGARLSMDRFSVGEEYHRGQARGGAVTKLLWYILVIILVLTLMRIIHLLGLDIFTTL